MIARILTAIGFAAALALSSAASAGPALLFDADNGAVLYAEDLDTQWHPASLTKIMTAYVTFQAIKDGVLTLESAVSCSKSCNDQGPTKLGLPIGGTITLETALEALIMKSANDVAVMLAEAVAGSHVDFVDYMNAVASRLGMTRTRFANANGLPDPDQVTTARDMARLAVAVGRDFPQYARMWSMLEMQVGKLHLRTHNDLLVSFAGADGMKTGFICDSGFNVIASATRQGHKLVAVVFGEATGQERSSRTANLLEYGFQVYPWNFLLASQTLDTLPIDVSAELAVAKPRRVISVVCGTGRRVASKPRKGRAVARGGAARGPHAHWKGRSPRGQRGAPISSHGHS
jgi:D-alanyl-D-alanine carboxypeptidase